MPIYTVHEPPPRGDEAAADPARFAFVRDGFHFWAFLLAPLWMLWRRLWLVFVLYLVFLAVLHTGLWLLGAGSTASFVVDVLVAILVGLEAPTMWRWTLARRRWTTIGVVSADDAETAERRFFDSWSATEPPHAIREIALPSGLYQPPPSSQAPAVLGLFPEPGMQR
jgi:hypothetical protein